MAITVTPEILGQQATAATTYCYLYEPLRVLIEESELSATRMYIDLQILDTSNDTNVIETLVAYGEYDINPGVGISVDLMKLARQYHDARVWKFAQGSDIYTSDAGLDAAVSKVKFRFLIYTNVTLTQTNIEKLPIIGGRAFDQFTPAVDQNSPVNEFEYYSDLNQNDYIGKWEGGFSAVLNLANPNNQNARPSISQNTSGDECIEAFLIWKSRFGGWMWWGFEIEQRTNSSSYQGNLEVSMFESTEDKAGNPYVPVDYTSIEMSYTRIVKSLSLSQEELLAVSGIKSSPAVYYLEPNKDGNNSNLKLELMRVGSASIPLDTKANGGDFSVTLKSISQQRMNTI